jgi:hypothetical protein
MTNIPYNLYNGSSTIYKNGIHILGSQASSNYYRYHYKSELKYDVNLSWLNIYTIKAIYKQLKSDKIKIRLLL